MLPSYLLFLMMLLAAFTPAQQTENGISQPAPGSVISGTVTVEGTAVHPDYLRYELAFLYVDGGSSEWIVFAEGDQQIINGTLAVWNTEVGRDINAPIFPDGRYQLRLRVVKTDFNYDEFFVTDIIISNNEATPEPTPDETAVALTRTAVNQPQPTVSDSDSSFQQATPIPSLTPFPTPTAPATPLGNEPQPTAPPESGGGLIGQVTNARWGRLGDAFVLGVTGTAVLFGLGILYILMRAVGRRLWRAAWQKQNSKGESN